jgi:hypothetical protein
MNFEQALIAHGLMPRRIVSDGKWYRCPTEDKPNRQNGAYLLWVGGQRGFYKNFATDDEYTEWRSDKPISIHDQRAIDNRTGGCSRPTESAAARANATAHTGSSCSGATSGQRLVQGNRPQDQADARSVTCNGLPAIDPAM